MLNSRLVERIGTRRLAHTGLALFTLVAAVHLGVAPDRREPLASSSRCRA